MAQLELDNMEYSSDALAQAAYVTNSIGTYSNTGGTIVVDGDYTVHIFNSSGTFTPALAGNIEILVVAGGGGGGMGGGGGGGKVVSSQYAVTAQGYAIVIGNGGAGGAMPSAGSNGNNSSFGSEVANGGGGGGGYTGNVTGKDGGCGGGGGIAPDGAGGSGTQGYNGGGGKGDGATYSNGGGGGGGGAVGVTVTARTTPGDGGIGLSSIIRDGSSIYYAGGGGGGRDNAGTTAVGGTGGGGNGGSNWQVNGSNGTANTGGGGGGSGGGTGGTGGSGIVIVRCKTSEFAPGSYLQSYSEATIKTQGSYSLKGVALITDSLNKTLTKTFATNQNLTGVKNLKFDIRASRTGSNIKIGIHDTGGTITEITPNIITADTWQTVRWDLSGVSDANKDAIDKIIVTIVNADAENTFYLDNVEIAQAIDVFGIVG